MKPKTKESVETMTVHVQWPALVVCWGSLTLRLANANLQWLEEKQHTATQENK